MKRNLDFNKVKEILVKEIRKFVGSKKAIIGVSGGIDSALVATLCVEALGKENVFAILMPYGEQIDIADSEMLIKHLGIKSETINIFEAVNQFKKTEEETVLANIKSRVRMINLYLFSNLHDGLVIGTTNKSEMALGYFTKFGDGACDYEPIADLFKTEVWALARFLGVPEILINKKPTAGLLIGQNDEDDFGFSYQELDAFLQGEKVESEIETKIKKMIENSEHKRHLPPSINVD
ncbi:MAG: NAD+ synthase [Candidatus Shapirobacteria bacterium]